VLPKDASENACKTRHFDAKFTPQPQAAGRCARVRYGVESGFRVRQTAERISDCEGLRATARETQGEHCSLRATSHTQTRCTAVRHPQLTERNATHESLKRKRRQW